MPPEGGRHFDGGPPGDKARTSPKRVRRTVGVESAGDAAELVADPADETVETPHTIPRSGALPRIVRLGRGHAGMIGVILVVALVMAGTKLMAAQGHDVPVAQPTPVMTPAATPSNSQTPSPPLLRVHVFGAVAAPGVVTLTAGARVTDAIAAAGGLTPDADSAELNLAASVPDGAQIVIGTLHGPRGELRTDQQPVTRGGGAGVGGTGPAAPTLNLNTATAQQLESLPGIGPVTANRIITWRDSHGGFTRIEELQEVDGIGPKTYAQLAPLVHV